MVAYEQKSKTLSLNVIVDNPTSSTITAVVKPTLPQESRDFFFA